MNTLIKPPCTNDTEQDKVVIPWLSENTTNSTSYSKHTSIFDKLRKLGGLHIWPLAEHNVAAFIKSYSEGPDGFEYSDGEDGYSYKKVTTSISLYQLNKMAGKYCKLENSELWLIYPGALEQAWSDFNYPFDEMPTDMHDSCDYSDFTYAHSLLIERVNNKFKAALIGPLGYINNSTDWPIRFADLVIGTSTDNQCINQVPSIDRLLNKKVYRHTELTYASLVKNIITAVDGNELNTFLLPIKLTFDNMSLSMYEEILYNTEAYGEDELATLSQVYAIDPICTYYNPIDDTVLVVHLSDLQDETNPNTKHIINFEVDYDYVRPVFNYNMACMNAYYTLAGKENTDNIPTRLCASVSLKLLDIFAYKDVVEYEKFMRMLGDKQYIVPNITCELVDHDNKTVSVQAEHCFNTPGSIVKPKNITENVISDNEQPNNCDYTF